MAKKTSKKIETTFDAAQITTENVSTDETTDTHTSFNNTVEPNMPTNITGSPFENHTIRELLDITKVASILGKKYENLAITEGKDYFLLKQKYNDLYGRVIKELENRVEKYIL